MKLIENKNSYIYRCSFHKTKKSYRAGSFLENSRITDEEFVQILYLFSHSISVSNAEYMAGVSMKTCIQWYQYFRDICSRYLINNPYQIGGVGNIVQIDESLISKRKNNVGRIVEEIWVFSGFDTTTKLGFIEFVPDRTKATLFNLIKKYIKPGTEIHSDSWPAYNGISGIDVDPKYIHLMVNHKENFVDPITGTHTNTVECNWKNCKQKFKNMLGVHTTMIDSYLDEFLWREIFGKTPTDCFNNVL